MRRVIKVPLGAVRAASGGSMGGHQSLIVPVKVDWPELRLSDEQVLANAIAFAAGEAMPYPDPSVIDIELPFDNSPGKFR